MSRLRALRHLLSSGGSSPLSLIFDTRWGTDSPATIIANAGWLTFGLNSGNRRIWVDSVNGNDANNGLTAATAKATYNAGWTLWTDSGTRTDGDQLMIAGGQGQTYTDDVTGNVSTLNGTAVHPNAVLSYNSTAPADATQYGRLVGSNMPIISLTDQSNTGAGSLSITAFTNGYLAVQGIEFKSINALAYQSLGYTYQAGNHPGLIFQNCRFNGVGLGFNPSTNTNTAAANAQGAHISKSSMWNASGFFGESYDSFWIQDFITVHNGWNIGACREDIVANGGAQIFTHNFYYHASNTNGRFDRVVTIDSSLEGVGARGDIAGASQIASIDNVVGIGPGGFSTSLTEAPNGINSQWDDIVIAGSSNCTPSNAGGWAMEWDNCLPGSYMRNVAVFENPLRGIGGNDRYAAGTNISSSQISQFMLCDKWSGWNFATVEQTSIGADATKIHLSWSNSTLEMVPLGNLGTVTNCASRSVAPSGYKTRAQTWTAMGFASKAAMINAMLYRPDLPWAQAICSISLPAMGLTPAYPLVSPPTVTSPPAVYPIALGALTLGTSSFAHAVSSSTMVGGTSGNPVLSSSDLPTGFTLAGRLLSYNGTGTAGTPTFHITETSLNDTLGSHTTAFTLSIS